MARKRFAMALVVLRYLAASVCEGLLNNPSISIEPTNIGGKQIVLDESPIFVLIGFQDGIIGAGGQRESPQRFSCLSVGRDFLPHHVLGNA